MHEELHGPFTETVDELQNKMSGGAPYAMVRVAYRGRIQLEVVLLRDKLVNTEHPARAEISHLQPKQHGMTQSVRSERVRR